MTTVEVLVVARKLIESDWWDGRENEGTYCAVAAIGQQLGFTGVMTHPAAFAVARGLGRDVNGVIAFNDTHTHAEVLAAFDVAILNERAKAEEFTVTPDPVIA